MLVLVFTAAILMTLGAIGAVIDRCAKDPGPPPRLRLVPGLVDGTGRPDAARRASHPWREAATSASGEPPLRHCG